MNKSKKIVLAVVAGIISLAVLAAAGYGIWFYFQSMSYQDKFYKNTWIGEVDCSLLTVEEAKAKMAARAEDYTLEIQLRDGSVTQLTGAQIGYAYNVDYVQDLKTAQGIWEWNDKAEPRYQYEEEHTVLINEVKLKAAVEALECVNPETATAPTNAYIETEGVLAVVKETQGNMLLADKVLTPIKEAVSKEAGTVDLSADSYYAKPEITTKSPEIAEMAEKIDNISAAEITYDFGYATEVVDQELIQQWLYLDDEGEPQLDTDKVDAYIADLAERYDDYGDGHYFVNSYGEEIYVENGNYGWQIYQFGEYGERGEGRLLIDDILNGKVITREPWYYYYAQGPRYEDGIGPTYIEISFDNQELFYYKDGELIIRTDIVTGMKDTEFATRHGLFKIIGHLRDQELKEYDAFVSYWMTVTPDYEVGIHDADWRSEFGGDVYSYNGSHGCINVPPSVMPSLFEAVADETPVIMY